MIEIIFLISLALIWIIFATIQDAISREVANWLNFSLIIFALGFRFFFGLFTENFALFYQGIIGFGIFLVLGNLFYYARMFAGGDAKLMIALGTILPLSESFMTNLSYFVGFFVIFLISGTVYGFIWSLVLVFRNAGTFIKEFPKQLRKNKLVTLIIILCAVIFLIAGFYNIVFFYLAILAFIFPYLLIYAKTIEETCMVKSLDTKSLREGDWLYRDIKVGKKVIRAKWDGLSDKEIKLIKKKLKNVKIKQGIPFVPVFLISFLIFSYGILFGSQNFVSFGFTDFFPAFSFLGL